MQGRQTVADLCTFRFYSMNIRVSLSSLVEFANLLIISPDAMPPTAFPATAGNKWAPATVFEALAVTWKYKGTENISWQ